MDKCCGEKLITLASAISFQISQNSSPEQISVLASLFTIIGDQLALLSITKSESDAICQ